MGVNLSALTNIGLTAQSLSNLVLVNPQVDQGIQPIGAKDAPTPERFLFHIKAHEEMNLTADISNHFIEDNTLIQDNIALAPEIYTVTGYIGELNNVPPEPLAIVRDAAKGLTAVVAYTPELTITALRAYNLALQAYQIANSVKNNAVDLWNKGPFGSKSGSQNLQQQAYQKFYAYYRSRTLFTVQTPWVIMNNMAIKSIRVSQDDETDMISNFEIQFQQMRFATAFTDVAPTVDGRRVQQESSNVDKSLVPLGESKPLRFIA